MNYIYEIYVFINKISNCYECNSLNRSQGPAGLCSLTSTKKFEYIYRV